MLESSALSGRRMLVLNCFFFVAGRAVLAALNDPQRFNRKRIQFRTVYDQPVSKWLEDLSDFTGRPVLLETASYSQLKDEQPYLAEIFGCQQEFGYYLGEIGSDLIDAVNVVDAPLTSWKQWLEKSDWGTQLKGG